MSKHKLIKNELVKGTAIGLVLSISLATFTALIFTGVIPLFPNIFNPNVPIDWNSTWIDGNLFGNDKHFSVNNVSTSFGIYPAVELNYSPSLPVVPIAPDLSNVNFQGLSVSDEVKALLAQYGFALVKEGYKDIFAFYDDDFSPDTPKFITTDLCLHAFHILYDTMLQKIEYSQFYDTFKVLITKLLESQEDLYKSVHNEIVKTAVKKNMAYLAVILKLLDDTSDIPSTVKELVTEEIDNINAGSFALSPIFNYVEDYSQYKPRGHYTNNATLERYFKAMMYTGRMTFMLKEPSGDPNIEQTRMALLLISSLNDTLGGKQLWDYWDRLYEPIKFFVGDSDDLTPKEYYQLWLEIGQPKGDQLVDEQTIQAFISLAENYRPPKINSMLIDNMRNASDIPVGLRLLGQRFTPDAYIFQQLVDPFVPGRLMPTVLDIFAVLGSTRAEEFALNQSSSYTNFEEQLNKLKGEFANITIETWANNLYMLWTYSLLPLLEPKGEGYPFFMQSNAWTDKALLTAMGSWTELKHDTILYAKQSYPPRGVNHMHNYIEPYPELYARLASLTRLLRNGLSIRGLMAEPFISKLEEAENIFANLSILSIRELENDPFTDEDYGFINVLADKLVELAKFFTGEYGHYTTSSRMALVADVFTDPNTGKVLEVATGDPYTIYVVVQDSENNLYLTKGGTYSYYEFTQPLTERLTDDEWYNILDTNPPQLPEWQTIDLPIINRSENFTLLMNEQIGDVKQIIKFKKQKHFYFFDVQEN